MGVLLAGGVAVAQAPGGEPGGGAPPGEMRGRGEMGGPGDMMRHGHMEAVMREMMHRAAPAPSKAARFMFRRGDALVNIKCADDEPMKACVDAGSALLDKLAAQQPK